MAVEKFQGWVWVPKGSSKDSANHPRSSSSLVPVVLDAKDCSKDVGGGPRGPRGKPLSHPLAAQPNAIQQCQNSTGVVPLDRPRVLRDVAEGPLTFVDPLSALMSSDSGQFTDLPGRGPGASQRLHC